MEFNRLHDFKVELVRLVTLAVVLVSTVSILALRSFIFKNQFLTFLKHHMLMYEHGCVLCSNILSVFQIWNTPS